MDTTLGTLLSVFDDVGLFPHSPKSERTVVDDDLSIWDVVTFDLYDKSDHVVGTIDVWFLVTPPPEDPDTPHAAQSGPEHTTVVADVGEIGILEWRDLDGDLIAALSGIAVVRSAFEAGAGNVDSEARYAYLVSLLDGNTVIRGSSGDDRSLEVGAGGTATVNGNGGDDTLYVWHDKTVSFNGGTGIDTLVFGYASGSFPQPANGGTVDLTAGTGTNPFGGTLTLSNVENVMGQFGASNSLRGNGQANILQSGIRADTLRGEGGNDLIGVKYHTDMNPRATLADGGSGIDTLNAELSFSDAAPFTGTGVNVQMRSALDLLVPSQNTGTFHGGSFLNFEIFRGIGDYYQVFDFRGSNAGETVYGAAGKDLLNGRGGNDVLNGNSGIDTMTGGLGNDTFYADTSLDKAVEAAGQGTDTVISTATFVLGSNLEHLTLGGFLAINGTGNGGANAITGNGAANVLAGGAGNDVLNGGAGNDSLNGGAGIDVLFGGAGRDRLTGGAGHDRFDYNSKTQSGAAAASRDIIKDFAVGLDDIDLSTIDANSSAAGNQKFAFVAAQGTAFTGIKGQLRWFQQNAAGTANDKTIVQGDINGDRLADFKIELTGLKLLHAADFVL